MTNHAASHVELIAHAFDNHFICVKKSYHYLDKMHDSFCNQFLVARKLLWKVKASQSSGRLISEMQTNTALWPVIVDQMFSYSISCFSIEYNSMICCY